MMDVLGRDLGHAFRSLRRRPGFTIVIVLTLALGIGANTAVFSVVRSVLLRPLPYPEDESLATVWARAPRFDFHQLPPSPPEYVAYREHARSWEGLAAFMIRSATLTGDGGEPERVNVALATPDLFPVLRTEPLLGRGFSAEEIRDEADAVAVLSHAFWTSRYGGDPRVIGRTVLLDGTSRTGLGVMPPDFRFPDANVRFWVPLAFTPQDLQSRGNHSYSVVGRLRPGVTLASAEGELSALVEGFVADPSINFHDWHPIYLRSLRADLVGDVSRTLWIMMGAVGLVLVIACANVANLLLVRAEERRREMSVRAAMGAGRRPLASQLFTESLIVAGVGGLAGAAVAYLGVEALRSVAPADLPRLDEIRVDAAVLAFTTALTMGAGVLFGLVPALHAGRTDLQAVLREEGRSGTAGRARIRTRQLLVVLQTALAVVLLVAAGLLLQSFRSLITIDPGFRAERVLTARLTLPAASYPEDQDVVGFYDALLERVASLPGVTAAGAAQIPPLAGVVNATDTEIEGWVDPGDAPRPISDAQAVTPGYFAALGIPLLEGRTFMSTDATNARLVAVVSETLAREYWPGRSALGGRIRLDWDDRQPFLEVVGVVADVRYERFDHPPLRGAFYRVHAQTPHTSGAPSGMTLTVRTVGEPTSLVSAVRREVYALDPSVPLYQVGTMERAVADATATPRLSMLLQTLFGLVALSLAAVGLYGVLAFAVARRTSEIGIRLALGAKQADVRRMVVRQGMVIVVGGLALGVGAALATSRILGSLLFGVSPRDPVTYATVVGVVEHVDRVRASTLDARPIRPLPLEEIGRPH